MSHLYNDGLNPVNTAQIYRNVGKGSGFTAPAKSRVQPGIII